MRCIYLHIEDYVTERVINLCDKQQMSMYRLAQVTGLRQSTISNIVKRRTLPNLITLEKIKGSCFTTFFLEWQKLDKHEIRLTLSKKIQSKSNRSGKTVFRYLKGCFCCSLYEKCSFANEETIAKNSYFTKY